MPTYILNTCGTSIITNNLDNDFRKIITQYTNYSDWNDIPLSDKQAIQTHINQRAETLLNADEQTACKMSAELNGLLTWQKTHQHHPQDIYTLLATDTIFGQETAKIIQTWLQNKGYQAQIISSAGLKTSNLVDFREALSGLVKTLIETLSGYKDSGYDICFNLTGGFKSLNGFLQAVSTIYADKTFYLFEGSKELLFIPKLPYTLNAVEIITQNLVAFRRLSVDLPVDKALLDKIPETLLFDFGGEIGLSEWGELLWQSSVNDIYKKQVLPSISDGIVIESSFWESLKNIPENYILQINKKIVQLAKYHETGRKDNLRSLDVKPLQEKQYKDHHLWECDIDGNNYRIFMQDKGDKFCLIKAGEALHKANSFI